MMDKRPDEPRAETAVEIIALNKWFGEFHVLRDIDLKVARGERIVICGPSGSGKSTLLRCINALEDFQRGEITVDGLALTKDVKRVDAIRREVGMVFQHFNLFHNLTALENIMEAPMLVLRVPRAEARTRALEALEAVGLAGRGDSYPSRLSGGQQQRVAIARALAMHPKVMLFDEPTSSLDPEMVHEVLQVMLDLSRQGMTMIIVTHEIQFANKAADRILFMDSGMIIEEGTPAELVNNPRNERTQKFLRLVTGGL